MPRQNPHAKQPDAALHQSGKGRFESVSDGASVIIGAQDSPDGDFVPGFRASKWGNVWLSCVASGVVPEKSKPKQTKDKAGKDCAEHASKRNGKSELHRFRDGSTKWEIEWARKSDMPSEGYVDFLLGFPAGLTFHKQPPLTPQEIDEGCVRPDNVVNSYAVYWPESGRILDRDGNEIINRETGKFAHIYRPNLVDADGREVWIDQTLILNGGTKLRVYLDSAWLAGARFPVTLDPTFGYTSVGASSAAASMGARLFGNGAFSLSESATASSVSHYLSLTGSAGGTFGIYTDSSGTPDARIVDTGTVTIGSADWYSADLDAPTDLSAGTYWIAWAAASGTIAAYYDSATGFARKRASASYSAGTLPATFGTVTATNADSKFSSYVTYTGSATGHPTRKRFGGVPFAAINRGIW